MIGDDHNFVVGPDSGMPACYRGEDAHMLAEITEQFPFFPEPFC